MSEPLIHADFFFYDTVTSFFYTDEDTFRNLISGMQDCWYFGAHSSQFAEHNVIPLTDIETMLGEALMLTNSDRVRCLSNVCTHRGMLVATEPCKSNTLPVSYTHLTLPTKRIV